MSYSDYEYYKPTLWDKIVMEGLGWISIILLFIGIWVSEFRWRLIATSVILFIMETLNYRAIIDRNKRLGEKSEAKSGSQSKYKQEVNKNGRS